MCGVPVFHHTLFAQPFEVARVWAASVTEEFYTQGDMEKERGFDILPMFDRQKADLAKGQIGFIDFLAAHQFNAMVDWYPGFEWTREGYKRTRGVWQVWPLAGLAAGRCVPNRNRAVGDPAPTVCRASSMRRPRRRQSRRNGREKRRASGRLSVIPCDLVNNAKC